MMAAADWARGQGDLFAGEVRFDTAGTTGRTDTEGEN